MPTAVAPSVFLRPVPNFREMSTADIIERVIPQCEDSGVEAIALSGGEVLVRRDAPEIFRALGRSKLHWCFDSNMMLCDKSVAHTVAESRCDSVFVSLDGPREIHNRLRGKPHAFDKCVAGLGHLLDSRRAAGGDRPLITINCVLQPGNESVPFDMAQLAMDFGVDELSFQLLSERRYTVRFDASLAFASLRSAQELADRRQFKTTVYPVRNPDGEALNAWFSMPLTHRFYKGCTYIYENLRIDPEGNVIPCLEYKMGNVLKQKLADIWDGPSYRAFRLHHTRLGPFDACLRCCNMMQA